MHAQRSEKTTCSRLLRLVLLLLLSLRSVLLLGTLPFILIVLCMCCHRLLCRNRCSGKVAVQPLSDADASFKRAMEATKDPVQVSSELQDVMKLLLGRKTLPSRGTG